METCHRCAAWREERRHLTNGQEVPTVRQASTLAEGIPMCSQHAREHQSILAVSNLEECR